MGAFHGRHVTGQPSTADPAALVQFAVDRVLRSEPGFDDLGDVLERHAAAWQADAALALILPPGGPPAVLAGHPPETALDPALAAAVVALVEAHPATAAAAQAGGAFQAPLVVGRRPSARPSAALVAWAAAEAEEQRCAIVAIGDGARWDSETRAVARMLAAIVAAQLRHADDRGYLREHESVTRALIKASPDAVLVMDAQQRVVAFNPAAEALYGWRREDVVGKDVPSMLIPARHRAAFIAAAQSFFDRREPGGELAGRVQLSALRADGSERPVELTPLPLMVSGQVYFCGFLRDLSEIEQATTAVRAREERFALLARRAPVAIAETGADGRCVFVNERWRAMAAVSADEHIGRVWLDVLHPDDLPGVRREWARATADGAELRAECRLREDGQPPRRVHVTAAPLPSRPGGGPGFLVALAELPVRERAEPGRPGEPSGTAGRADRELERVGREGAGQERAEHAERLHCLIATAVPGVVFGDEHGRVAQLNESFCGFFGLAEPPEEFVGVPLESLRRRVEHVLADPAGFAAAMGRLIADRRPVSGEQIACADGRVLEYDYWPLFMAGEHRGDIWLFWDMTERSRQAERQARQLRTVEEARASAERERRDLAEQILRLRELSDLKTQFLATVSHELRQPLTSIVSYTELVSDEKGRLSPDAAGFLDVIERNAQQMTRLVGDLLLLSRIESGVVPLEVTPVPVGEVLQDVVRSVRPAAARRGIEVAISAGEGPPIQADRARLRQVVENLVANAVKFSLAGGKVEVDADWSGQQWRIEVADCGIGIPPDELGFVFDRFFRASNSRRSGRPGSGLGLSVVRALTEMHGGRVEAAGREGGGATFTVYLPAPAPEGSAE